MFGYSPFYSRPQYPNYYPYYGGYRRQPPPEDDYYYPRGRNGIDAQSLAQQRAAQERARALAEARARRAQWLPDEDDNLSDDWEYNSLGPRERAYVAARQKQAQLERQERERRGWEDQVQEDRWQSQLEEKQREDEERRRKILEEQRKVQQQKKEREEARRKAEAAAQEHQRKTPVQSRDNTVPVNRRSPSPGKRESPSYRVPVNKPESQSQPQPPRPQTPKYDETHEQAASQIQSHYRVHQSFKTIRGLEKQFSDLKEHFTFPSTLDFQNPHSSTLSSDEGSVNVRVPESALRGVEQANAGAATEVVDDMEEMDVDTNTEPEGKLAYTSNNYNLHAYMENLSKLLMKLDGVESWGNRKVRNERRAVVKQIEEELSRIESIWKRVWRECGVEAIKEKEVEKQKEKERQKEKEEEGERAEEATPQQTAEDAMPVDS